MKMMKKMTNKKKNWIIPGFLIVSFLGFLDSLYLTIQHFLGGELACSIVKGCDVVTSSVYSMIGPIPVAALGVAYYLAIFGLTLLYWDTGKKKLLKILGWSTVAGLLTSIYFLVIQAFVLNAFCQYCLGSAMTSTILFIMGMNIVLRKN